MASARRVVDFMSGMPDAFNHMMHGNNVINSVKDINMLKDVDGLEEEKKWLGAGERMIISNLTCQVKFTRKGMKDNINLRLQSSARGHSGEGQITRYKTNSLSFINSSHPWWLKPATAYVRYTSENADSFSMSHSLRNQILSRCTTLSSEEADAMNLKVIQRKLSTKSDMRHIFVKLYLTLMDYNLAVCSKEESMSVAETLDLEQIVHSELTQAERLVLTANHEVVVDPTGMTAKELGLLALGAAEYPSVWYCGDNIYNNVQMEHDDVVIVSDHVIKINTSLAWGSPDRLLQTMWSLACKLDCTEDMGEAFSMMRGQCGMVDKMFSSVRSQNYINIMLPKSSSLRRSFDITTNIRSVSAPAYLSTSMSLLTDRLLSEMMECSATCVVEELGGIGKALSSATPSTSRTFNGLLRDYGIEHSDPTINVLLQNWFSVTGRPLVWGYGRLLKLYIIELTTAMVNGWDVAMPQLITMIPYMHTPNTTWGYSRNWTGTSEVLSLGKKKRKEQDNKLAANSWLMGLRETRPRVFRNTFSHEELVLGPTEYELAAEVRDGCTVKTAQIFLQDSVGGRVDEIEKTARALLPSEYVGTVCSLIYDISAATFVKRKDDIDYDKIIRESFKGETAEKVTEPQDRGIRAFTHGGVPKDTDPFAHLRKAEKGLSIRPDKRPVHVREGSRGGGFVSPYSLDGESSSEPLPLNVPNYDEKGTYNIREIEVSGDGSCGVHAIVEDLKAHGLLSGNDTRRANEIFMADSRASTFHDSDELAGLAERWGFGLDVYDKVTNTIHRLHDGGKEHHITLIRDGAQFNAGLVTADTKGKKLAAVKNAVTSSGAKQKVIDNYGELFGDTKT